MRSSSTRRTVPRTRSRSSTKPGNTPTNGSGFGPTAWPPGSGHTAPARRPSSRSTSTAAAASATQFTLWTAEHIGIQADDRVAQRTPVAWDIALVEPFLAFDRGASVVVVSTEATADPATLIETVNEHRITVLWLVPSLLGVHL